MVIITEFSPPEVGVLHHEPSCQLLVDGHNAGTGDLYVTESAIMWANGDRTRCITFMYRRITLHAVQRVPSPLIYMMLDYKLVLPEQMNGQDADEDDEFDPNEASTEIKFVSQDPARLTDIFVAMNTGQSLHPDTDNSDSDDDAMIAEDEEAPDADAASRLEGLSIKHQNGNGYGSDEDDDQQFADA